jgi:hypothetical protein
MKKTIVRILCLCLITIVGNAQERLETEPLNIGGDNTYEVIVPTMNNLITIVNMDVATFKATMNNYRYHPDEQLAGRSYVYTNLNIDFYLDNNQGRGVNTIMFDPSGSNKFAGFWVLDKEAYPRNCIADLCQELAPYYQKTVGGTRFYAMRYDGYSYGIKLGPSRTQDCTVIHIYKFYK